jgi:hypothetical protein
VWDQQQLPATPLRVKHTLHVLPLPSRGPSKMLHPCNKKYQKNLKGVVYRCTKEAFFTLEDSPTASDCELRAHHMSRRHETTAPGLDQFFMTDATAIVRQATYSKFSVLPWIVPFVQKGGYAGIVHRGAGVLLSPYLLSLGHLIMC